MDDAVGISNLETVTLHDSYFSTTVRKLPVRVQSPCPTVEDLVLTPPHVQEHAQSLELAQFRPHVQEHAQSLELAQFRPHVQEHAQSLKLAQFRPRARELDFLHMVG